MQQGKWRKIRFLIPLFFVVAFGFFSWVVQILWNWLIAPTFSLSPYSYWQAMGLLVLCRILFGGFRFGGAQRSGKPPFNRRNKWMNMSEEERQQFKSEWEKRCEKRD